jgi:hypothetical protein
MILQPTVHYPKSILNPYLGVNIYSGKGIKIKSDKSPTIKRPYKLYPVSKLNFKFEVVKLPNRTIKSLPRIMQSQSLYQRNSKIQELKSKNSEVKRTEKEFWNSLETKDSSLVSSRIKISPLKSNKIFDS